MVFAGTSALLAAACGSIRAGTRLDRHDLSFA